MKKVLSLIITIALATALISACGKSNKMVSVYFKDATENKLNEEKRAIPEKDKKDAKEIAKFAVAQMIAGPQSEGNKTLFPENTKLLSIAINGGVATLDFSKSYNEAHNVSALLLRLSIVNTLCGINGIDGVVINVEGKPIVSESTGKEFGVLSLENIAFETNDVQNGEKTTVSLYFPQKNGDKLVRENRSIKLQSALSLEKAVIGELIKGPEKDGCTRALPTDVKLIGIETKNNVCFVNFSSEFVSKTPSSSLTTTLSLYSVVNSLCELEGVESVQILVNGENGVEFGNFVLDIPYEKNDGIVK